VLAFKNITRHSSRTNNSWLLSPSLLILTNYYLPLNGALYSTRSLVVNSDNDESFAQVKSDAIKAIWILVALNVSVVILYVIQSFDLAFAILFVQAALFLFWLLPVALYQIIRKNNSIKLSAYKALSSYRNIMEQVSW
jgi:hypothetical protein